MGVQDTAADGVIEAFNKARATGAGVYDATVGYGEEYPQHDEENLVVKMNNSATGVHFRDQTYERGFDQTHFGSGTLGAKRFKQLLAEVGLDPMEDFVRVFRDLGRGCNTEYPDYWLYVWCNDHVMVATTCNPFNGDPASKTVSAEQGYAGYIGIGGEKSKVETATAGVESVAHQVKDRRDDGLFF
jgi:hypothetical protein